MLSIALLEDASQSLQLTNVSWVIYIWITGNLRLLIIPVSFIHINTHEATRAPLLEITSLTCKVK